MAFQDLKLRFIGYRCRIKYADFFAHYGSLAPELAAERLDAEQFIRRLLSLAMIEDCRFLNEVVYLKPTNFAQLNSWAKRIRETQEAEESSREELTLPDATGNLSSPNRMKSSSRRNLSQSAPLISGNEAGCVEISQKDKESSREELILPDATGNLSSPNRMESSEQERSSRRNLSQSAPLISDNKAGCVEISQKDKGIISFMKGVITASTSVLNTISWGGVVLSFATSGHYQTDIQQKATLMGCAFSFTPFSFITAGVIQSLEEHPERLSAASWMILLEMWYFKLNVSLLLIFIAKLPCYGVLAVTIPTCVLVTSVIVAFIKRPTFLYVLPSCIKELCCMCKN